jgi:hypothetical protein
MAIDILKSRLMVVAVAAIVAWFFGMYVTTLSESALPTVFAEGSSITLIAVSVFAFSLLFFGYPSPFIMFLGGIFAGNRLGAAELDAFTVALSLACILASYSSVRLGDALLDDLIGKGNFKSALKISLILAGVFLAIAIGFDLMGG